jgi:hypothetical protein
MRHALALVLTLVATSAVASSIERISPASIVVGSGEYFLTIEGAELGSHVVYKGPAGRYEVDASASTGKSIVVWVPVEVVNTAGQYEVTVIGGSSAARALLTVTDPEPHPLVILLPDPIVAEAESRKGAIIQYEVSAYGGSDPDPTVTCDPPSGSQFPLGPSEIHCRADNRFGEHAEATLSVFVYDGFSPLLKLPDDITVEAESADGAVVAFEVSAHDAIDGELEVICAPKSGSRFPIGATTVQCEAIDSSLNPAYGSFEVVVREKDDDRVLLIQVPDEITAEATSREGAIVDFTVTTHGSEDPEPEIACDPVSGATFPLGKTEVVCRARDRFGNEVEGRFVVIVADTTPPGLQVEDITVAAERPDGTEVKYEVTASDLIDGEVAAKCEPASGSFFPIGTTRVKCSASDASGNEATAAFEVTVTDETPPRIVFLDVDPDVLSPANHKLVPVDVSVEVVDEGDDAPFCSVVDVTSNEEVVGAGSGGTDFDWRIAGALRVELRAERSGEGNDRIYELRVRCADKSGNAAFGAVTVTVPKGQAESELKIEVPETLVAEATSPDGAVVEYEVRATNARGAHVSASCLPASGSLFAVGRTRVTCTAASDGAQGRARFDVEVSDTTPPHIAALTPSQPLLEASEEQLVPVTLAAAAFDLTDVSPRCAIVDVTSNEAIRAADDGSAAFDWRVTGPLTLDLRAARAADRDRVYEIRVACRDRHANESQGLARVTVVEPGGAGERVDPPQRSSRRRAVGK